LHEVIAVTTNSGTTMTDNNIINNNSSNVRNAEIIGKTLAKAYWTHHSKFVLEHG
jgi:hypothetical protein